MSSAEDKATSPSEEDKGPAALLVYALAGLETHALPARGAVSIGRVEQADVPIDDASVSRRHAVLRLGAGLSLEDLGSSNGTFVNGRRLVAGEKAAVAAGDVIRVGDVALMIRGGPGRHARAPRPTAPAIVVSDKMKEVYRLVDQVAASTIAVLLLGETGVGKEVVARQVHARSSRRAGPFLGLNCAALTETLVESELFGHEKGAFTGADAAKAGLLENAAGGTVFLDELGELPPGIQAKLLRVLEERQVRRVGSFAVRPIDVRFVTATNRDLEAEVAAGRFREDLFFRLNGFTLRVPPLRDRAVEIEPLARHFVALYAEEAGLASPPALAAATVARLVQHAWPGNVRELRNVIQRAVLLSGGEPIEPTHLPAFAAERRPGDRSSTQRLPAGGADLRGDVKREVEGYERERILAALETCRGNQTHAAKLLGISRRALITKLDQYGFPRPRKQPP